MRKVSNNHDAHAELGGSTKLSVTVRSRRRAMMAGEWADYLSQANPLIRGSLSKASFANAIESFAIRIQPARHWHLSEASSFDVQWARALQKSLEAILPDWAIGWGHEQRDILLSLRRLVVQLRPRLGSPSSPLSHTARRAQQTDLSSNRGRRMTGVHRQRLCILQDFVATAFVVTLAKNNKR